jgi:NADH-quinone oxidoreductase subunit J
MLTRSKIGRQSDLNNSYWWAAALTAVLLLGTLTYVLIDAFEDRELPEDVIPTTTREVSDRIFGPYLLPFWALSFVLLAAMIGAIVLARRD